MTVDVSRNWKRVNWGPALRHRILDRRARRRCGRRTGLYFAFPASFESTVNRPLADHRRRGPASDPAGSRAGPPALLANAHRKGRIAGAAIDLSLASWCLEHDEDRRAVPGVVLEHAPDAVGHNELTSVYLDQLPGMLQESLRRRTHRRVTSSWRGSLRCTSAASGDRDHVGLARSSASHLPCSSSPASPCGGRASSAGGGFEYNSFASARWASAASLNLGFNLSACCSDVRALACFTGSVHCRERR